MIPENDYYSYNIKELPVGCQYCVKGEKLVLFVTGICPRNCYFCPVSDKKYGYDVVFANERQIKLNDQKKINTEIKEIIKEAELMQAKGAGITGGDPLIKLKRTLGYIKLLKKKFGKNFHIHLYTSLNLVTKKTLKQLHEAGLDEIRFHLDFDSNQFWKNLELAKQFDWDVGVEIPSIPGKEKEMKEIVDFIDDKVKFVNLNELEIADNKMSKLGEMGYEVKEKFSYAIKDSIDIGKKLMEYVQEKDYSLAVHLCTAKLKDKIQLTNRIKRESVNTKKEFDLVDDEGLLTRGALYLKDLVPGFDYRKKLEAVNKSDYIKELKPLFEKIKTKFHLNDNQIFLDEEKPRILISAKKVIKNKKLFKKLNLIPAVVTEYPTADQLEIEVELF